MKILCIGDLHIVSHTLFQFKELETKVLAMLSGNTHDDRNTHDARNRVSESEQFVSETSKLDVDKVVLLGDILHFHNKIDVNYMNLAIHFIDKLSALLPVIILVGNHDKTHQGSFLTNDSWMNGIKKWHNVTVVDSPMVIDGVLYCPHVSPGRFNEAIDSYIEHSSVNIAICHQEFYKCWYTNLNGKSLSSCEDKISAHGDIPNPQLKLVISGHMHTKHTYSIPHGDNSSTTIYYVGTPYATQHGECSGHLSILNSETMEIEDIVTGVSEKKTIRYNISDITSEDSITFPDQNTRLILSGTSQEISVFKKSKLCQKLLKRDGIVKFNVILMGSKTDIDQTNILSFKDILFHLIGDLEEKTDVIELYTKLTEG